MKYIIILIAFLILAAYTQDIYESGKQKIATHQIAINALRKSINYLQTEMITVYPYLRPIHREDYKYMSSPFGLRTIPSGIYTGGSLTREHQGIDITGTKHARVIAIADGKVIEHWPGPDGYWSGHSFYGGMIKIRHADNVESLYAHLSATYVNETTKCFVKAGQVIGRIGETGLTDGEHLHFEIRKNGIPVQPLKYINLQN